MKEYKIYKLIDPETKIIKYIGCTTSTLNERLSQHIYDARKKNSFKSIWIKSLLEKEKKPIIKLIEICTEENWIQKEQYYINFYYKNLTNFTKGGDGMLLNRQISSIKKSSEKKFVKIQQYTLEGVYIKTWESIKDACEKLKLSTTSLGNCLNKRSKSCGGYLWKYFDNSLSNIDKYIPKNSKVRKKPWVIVMYENNALLKTFSTLREVLRKTNYTYYQVFNSIKTNNFIKNTNISFKKIPI